MIVMSHPKTGIFYTLTARTPQGKLLPMSDYKDNVVLIVNTATRCGLAPQFEGLEQLHLAYKEKGLVVIGFPCDQFAGQEPESNATMEEVCKVNHGVTFRLTEKVDVNGPDTHAVFRFLKKELPGLFGSRIKWNFTKFVLDRSGRPVKRFAPITKPERLEKLIQQLLA